MPTIRHPPMVCQGFLPIAYTSLGVEVAANEEDQNEGEEEGYDGVADGHTCL